MWSLKSLNSVKLLDFDYNCHTIFMATALSVTGKKLRRFNDGLTALLMVLGLYMVLSPFLPNLLHRLHPPALAVSAVVQVLPNTPPAVTPIPDGAELAIPRLNLTEIIHTGSSIAELSKGVWLVPRTSTPDQSSNTVIIGHRFTYAGPAVFYFLDKVQLNDRITVAWQHKEYTYKVAAITVVPPTEIAVQNATAEPQLTLYTCTPLITAKNRLVITAPLVGVRS